MKRRNLFRTVALALLSNAAPRLAKAQPTNPSQDSREIIAAIAEAVLPSTLGSDRRPGRSTRSKDGWMSTMLAFR